jgi:hypothetical protein
MLTRSEFGLIKSLSLAGLFAGCSTFAPAPHPENLAEQRAVSYLSIEVPAWGKANGCFSCHNNGDGARALYLASQKGYRLQPQILEETTRWLKTPDRWNENKGDPGFNDQRLANLQFAASLQAAVQANAIERPALQIAARRVAIDQTASGEWPIDQNNAVGSPATYGSTLASYIALGILENAKVESNAIHRAQVALRQVEPNNTVSAAVLLLGASRGIDAGKKYQTALDLISAGEKSDGGWGPYSDSPPEPFDTALVLLALKSCPNSAAPSVGQMIK